MEHELSPQNQLYLDQIIAGGLFPSREAALDAAIAALREKTEAIPFAPAEHMEAIERGIDQADAGLSRLMTEEDWARLRQRARDGAARTRSGNA
jgi:hypothetical protein